MKLPLGVRAAGFGPDSKTLFRVVGIGKIEEAFSSDTATSRILCLALKTAS
jgi:hypothetical protein